MTKERKDKTGKVIVDKKKDGLNKLKNFKPSRDEQLLVDKPLLVRKLDKTDLEPGEIRQYMRHVFSKNFDPVDLNNVYAIELRFTEYFKDCINNGFKPTLAGLANSIGVNTSTLKHWRATKSGSDEHHQVITRAYNILEELLEMYMIEGRIPSLNGIFLLKNNFGYTDKTNVELNVGPTEMNASTSVEVIRQKYLTNNDIEDVGEEIDIIEE